VIRTSQKTLWQALTLLSFILLFSACQSLQFSAQAKPTSTPPPQYVQRALAATNALKSVEAGSGLYYALDVNHVQNSSTPIPVTDQLALIPFSTTFITVNDIILPDALSLRVSQTNDDFATEAQDFTQVTLANDVYVQNKNQNAWYHLDKQSINDPAIPAQINPLDQLKQALTLCSGLPYEDKGEEPDTTYKGVIDHTIICTLNKAQIISLFSSPTVTIANAQSDIHQLLLQPSATFDGYFSFIFDARTFHVLHERIKLGITVQPKNTLQDYPTSFGIEGTSDFMNFNTVSTKITAPLNSISAPDLTSVLKKSDNAS
jgi:hypothetical protein